jgi:hypothetical protein
MCPTKGDIWERCSRGYFAVAAKSDEGAERVPCNPKNATLVEGYKLFKSTNLTQWHLLSDGVRKIGPPELLRRGIDSKNSPGSSHVETCYRDGGVGMCCSPYLAAISLEPVKAARANLYNNQRIIHTQTARRLHAPFNEHDNGICSRMCQGALFAVVNHEVVRPRSSRASAPRDR